METNKKTDLKQRKISLKSKLMSTLALLLVATVMMGSSTYAWFVLSTAPEVKNMSTTVGANGSLEIALQSSKMVDGEYQTGAANRAEIVTGGSYVTDNDFVRANVLWGNILDLGNAAYGISTMKLYPAQLKLDASDTTKVDLANPLVTAKYGVDGRVASVDKTLTSALYTEAGFIPGAYGVQGIGEFRQADNTTKTQVNYSDIVERANTEIDSRVTALPSTMQSVFSNSLFDLQVISEKDDEAVLTDGETATLRGIVESVQGQAEAMREALGFALMAERAAAGYDFTQDNLGEGIELTMASLVKYYRELPLATISGAADASQTLKDAATALSTTIGSLESAHTALATPPTGAQAKPIVRSVMDYRGMTLVTDNGATKTRWPNIEGSGTGKLQTIRTALQTAGNYVVLDNQCGAMAELAAIAGDYQITLSAMGITVPMYVTSDSVDTFNPSAMSDGALAEIMSGLTGADTLAFEYTPTGSVGNTYAFAVDLAFRTNSDGNLLLVDSEGAMRVSNATDTALKGSGSTLNFGNEALNAAVYVVFMDTDNGTIYAVAKHDGSGANGLVLANYEVSGGTIVVGDAKGDNVITALTGDMTPKFITALVYLDGTKVNESTSTSVGGSMNLQFASSATLQPMAYTGYEGGNGEAGSGNGQGGQDETPELAVTADTENITVGGDATLSVTYGGNAITDATKLQITTDSAAVSIDDFTVTGSSAGDATITVSYTPEGASEPVTAQITIHVA